mmetsp:Transcript_37384/g.63633  ORF Transcript_37384/g.63633 Transcript_37384/m.63633 type:complete len:397 (-) Transcript_37384:428-1618(-)
MTNNSDSPPQSIALAIAPKITSSLSIVGSIIILNKVLRSPKRRRHPMHRIMVGLSVADILSGISFFGSTWPIPRGTVSRFAEEGTQQLIYGAVGTERSCDMAGFFCQMQVASPLLNATLATYYLLTVRYSWRTERIQKIEWIFFAVPFGFALFTSIFVVAANLIGHVEWTCWILPAELSVEGAKLTSIQQNFRTIQWLFLFAPVWVCIVYVSIIFVLLYIDMRNSERTMLKYSIPYQPGVVAATGGRNADEEDGEQGDEADDEGAPSGTTMDASTNPNQQSSPASCHFKNKKSRRWHHEESRERREASKSRKVAIQGMLYVIAFYIAWLFPTVTRITDLLKVNIFAIQFLDTTLLPLQGALNCMVYLRPRYNVYREAHPNHGMSTSMWAIMANIDA